jgi:GTP diphosphokinase / guanosine-3',5'-bis(diphosphate) 3'-diphosphatase
MIRISDIIDKITEYNPDADLELIDRAYIFSAKVHDGQVRLSGEPYLSHPLEVAGILADMKLDVVSVAAGLLHDVIEDTHATAEELGELFGPEVLHIVSGVTKLSTLPFSSAQDREAESIRKMLLAMADDIRVVLIKLADRMHNMRTLQYHPANEPSNARSPAKRWTSMPRSPRAWASTGSRTNSRTSLSSTSNPEEYVPTSKTGGQGQESASKYIETVKPILKRKMDENNLPCEVLGRYKNYYSIHQKMMSRI